MQERGLKLKFANLHLKVNIKKNLQFDVKKLQ